MSKQGLTIESIAAAVREKEKTHPGVVAFVPGFPLRMEAELREAVRREEEFKKKANEEQRKIREAVKAWREQKHYRETAMCCARCKHCDVPKYEEDGYSCGSMAAKGFPWWAKQVEAWGLCDDFEQKFEPTYPEDEDESLPDF